MIEDILLRPFEERLRTLHHEGLLRNIQDKKTSQGPRIIINNKELINFASNDYLGLANHPLVIKAAIQAIDRYGMGSGASRLLGGGTDLHKALEEKVAAFKGTPSALVLNSGYTANVSCIPCLVEEGDYIFSDELNHASIIDGIRLSKAKVFIYKHKDITNLEELLYSVKNEKTKKIIITDSVFSMDGDIAPIRELIELSERYDALLYVDDAHATGVLGNGRGSLAHFGPSHKPFIIQMGTFSKALGTFGAYVASEGIFRDWFINRARGFIYSTALPPSVIAATIKSIELIESNPELIKRLWFNRERLLLILKNLGLETGFTETPIIPVIFRNIEICLKVYSKLYEHGIYAPAIRPPTVKTPRIRFTVSSAHTEEDLDIFERVMKRLRQTL